ncbi:MAG: arsenate reductase ArsC [Deltaproteobacteria bacterium]|nr:arsenate reductase ArsC [Deltaproteobacteria bacterium]
MEKLNILFLCTGNSCRSQMAEGWVRHMKADSINAYSAGINPHGLDSRAVLVMKEVGIDISHHQSKHVDHVLGIPFDYVITVCSHAHETCPVFPGKATKIHHPFDDPPRLAKAMADRGASEEDQLNCYRKVRDEIKAFVDTLPESLNKAKKGFIAKIVDQLDKKLEDKAKKTSCCTGNKKGGSSCC